MNYEKVFKQGVAYGVLFTLIILATIHVLFQGFIRNGVVSAETELKLTTIKGMVQQKYLYSDKIDEDKIQDGIITGYLYGLDDPYAGYYNKEEAHSIMKSTEGKFAGIGVVAMQNSMTKEIVLTEIMEDTPSEKSGLKVGDFLYKVDGKDITNMTLSETVLLIQGEPGTEVDITILRGDNKKEHTFTITRSIVEPKSVKYEMKEDKVGYVKVSEFVKTTTDQFKNAINDLEKQGMKSLIIDLRDNPGGELTTVCSMCDFILPEGTIMSTKYKNGKGEVYKAVNKDSLDIPMIILVNENSASASEVFAGAMKDHNKATLIGVKTFGKGSVQELRSLNDGTMIKFTVAEYLTPNGTSLNKKGIKPDIEVERKFDMENLEYDNQLDEAVKEAKKIQK